jgi:hypothetical protein
MGRAFRLGREPFLGRLKSIRSERNDVPHGGVNTALHAKVHLNSFVPLLGDDNADFDYHSKARFREVKVYVKRLALWRYLGFKFLVNASRRFRKFWEFYLCFVVRGKVMTFEFERL